VEHHLSPLQCVAAARQTRRSSPFSLDGETQCRLAQALPSGSRLVVCRAAVILHDDRGSRVDDGFDDTPLSEGEPDARVCRISSARPRSPSACQPGPDRFDQNALNARACIAPTRAIGPIPDGLGVTWGARYRAGAVWGRADPRFIPEAVVWG